MDKDNRIAIDLLSLKEGNEYDLDFELTEKEMKYFPNLLSLNDSVFVLDVIALGALTTVSISVNGDITLLDAHDQKERDYHLDDSVELTISTEDEENSDLLPDEDGLYDLRGSILALLFNAIPQNYSEVPLKRI